MTPATAVAPPPAGPFIALLVALTSVGLAAMTMCLPSMPSWEREFGASAALVAMTFSGFVLALGLLQVVHGPLSDRHGRRPVLLVGLAVALAGTLAAAGATTIAQLIAGRALQGAGCAAAMVVGRALVQDRFRGPQGVRAMAAIGMAMGLVPPLATLVGGWLHAHVGWRAGFWFVALLVAGLLALVWRWRAAFAMPVPASGPELGPGTGTGLGTPPASGGAARRTWPREMLAPYRTLLRERAFVLHAAMVAMTTATFYAFLGGAPKLLGGMGVTPERLGLYIMVVPLAYIAGNFSAARLIAPLGSRTMVGAGQAATLAGVGLALALAVLGVHHPFAFTLPLLLLGFGHGLLVPPALAATVGAVPALAGAAAAGAGLAQQLFGAVGGWIAGVVPHDDGVALGALMVALSAAGASLWFALPRGAARLGP